MAESDKIFLYKYEIASRYGLCVKTLSKFIERVKDQLPMYIDGQKRFSPVQVKKLDEIYVYGV